MLCIFYFVENSTKALKRLADPCKTIIQLSKTFFGNSTIALEHGASWNDKPDPYE